MMLRLARCTQHDYQALAQTRSRAQLVAIPYSHFCELGIWALQACRVPCDEHGFAPGQHVLPVLALRLGRDAKHLSTSSAVRPVAPAGALDPSPAKMPARPNPTAVPVAALPDGRVLVDSWSIVAHAAELTGLEPVPESLKDVLDTELGPRSRQLAYATLLKPEHWDVWQGLCIEGGSTLWRCLWRLGLGKKLTQMMTKVQNRMLRIR